MHTRVLTAAEDALGPPQGRWTTSPAQPASHRDARTSTAAQPSALGDLAGLVMHEMAMRSATRGALFSGD